MALKFVLQNQYLLRSTACRLSPSVSHMQLPYAAISHDLLSKISGYRRFNNSTRLEKKGGKGKPEKNERSEPQPLVNVLDISELESSFQNAQDRLREELSKLRPGGRLGPEHIESLRVQLDMNSKKETFRVSDLAQVIPKGRAFNVIVEDKDYIKAVSSSISASNLNLNPQQDPHNPLQLSVPIPTATAETRQEVLKVADSTLQSANKNIGSARADFQKKMRDLEKNKQIRKDDFYKAIEKADKAVKKANEEAKKITEAAKKALQNG